MASKENGTIGSYDYDEEDDYFSCLSEFPPYSSNEYIFGGRSSDDPEVFYDHELLQGNLNPGFELLVESSSADDFGDDEVLWAIRHLFREGDFGQIKVDIEEAVMIWKYDRFFNSMEFSGGDSDDEKIPDFDVEFPKAATNPVHIGIILLENGESASGQEEEQKVPKMEPPREESGVSPPVIIPTDENNNPCSGVESWFQSQSGIKPEADPRVKEVEASVQTPTVIHGRGERFQHTASDNVLCLSSPQIQLKPGLSDNTALDLKKAELGFEPLDALEELIDELPHEAPDASEALTPSDQTPSSPKKEKTGCFSWLFSCCKKKKRARSKSGSDPNDASTEVYVPSSSTSSVKKQEVLKPP